MDDKEKEDLKSAYQAVLSTHDAIADFRSKLLALLPFATGAGIFFLIKGLPSTVMMHLSAIGLSGILVTMGLFFYELKNIQKCRSLIVTGKLLERKIFGEYYHLGAFHGGRIADENWFERLKKNKNDSTVDEKIVQIGQKLETNFKLVKRNWLSNTRAALFVYPTVISGWAYLGSFGIVASIWLKENINKTADAAQPLVFGYNPLSVLLCLLVAIVVFFTTFLLARRTDERYHRMLRVREQLLNDNIPVVDKTKPIAEKGNCFFD